ncbi:predicted protein [Thalassiosira pseudonana CCMP1335]|uniref:Spp2/MOS2 G-patch domain-containing protein n=1 Tax=Thalassiosira pseudonana TaxID=35128 RepID=B8CB44_THAPS|nr:predicted protein [Thalassiosira pseudonana CCMP1335]EED89065.1 predicted protein [Thalassiosira pseudonana CCMP1335]
MNGVEEDRDDSAQQQPPTSDPTADARSNPSAKDTTTVVRAKINISLKQKKKSKPTTSNSTNASNLTGKSSLLAEEYSTIAEEARAISQRRHEEGTILVIPCEQKKNEGKREAPLLAARLALLNRGGVGGGTADAAAAADGGAQEDAIAMGAVDTDATNTHFATIDDDGDIDDEAVMQLIQSAKDKDGTTNDNGDRRGTQSKQPGFVIAAPSKNSLNLRGVAKSNNHTTNSSSGRAGGSQSTAAPPPNDEEIFKQELAHHAADVDPTSNVYANVSIGDFGSALLRGMGWNGSASGNINNNGNSRLGGGAKRLGGSKPTDEEVIKPRPHRLGLGATPLPPPTSTNNGGSSSGGIHRRARRPEEVKREEERVRAQEEIERKAAEKIKLDVQVTLQNGSVVWVRKESDDVGRSGRGRAQRAVVAKAAGVPGLNRLLVKMEGSTEDVSVTKGSVTLCSWDELKENPFRMVNAKTSSMQSKESESSGERHRREDVDDGLTRRKRSSSRDRGNREESHKKRRRNRRERSTSTSSRSDSDSSRRRHRKKRERKHDSKESSHNRDRRRDDRRRVRSRSPDDRHSSNRSKHHLSSSHNHSKQQHLHWLLPNIRVRFVSNKIPKFYLQKGIVQDVIQSQQSSPKAVLLMDSNGQVLDNIPERYLETALPKTGGNVIVLEGRYRWKKGRLLERSSGDGSGVVQLFEDLEVVNISLDSVAEWCGPVDDDLE